MYGVDWEAVIWVGKEGKRVSLGNGNGKRG